MQNNHLTYFKVENFKKFESLELNDIGQFNLIVGDNNVGKTCLLEALLFDEDANQLLSNFYIGLTKRGLIFEIKELSTKIGKNIQTEISYPKENYFRNFIVNKDNLSLKYSFDKDSLEHIEIKPLEDYDFEWDDFEHYGVDYNDLGKQFIVFSKIYFLDLWQSTNQFTWIYNYDLDILNFPLISFNESPLEKETTRIYESLKTKKEKQTLINTLKVVNPNIIDIELRENFEDLKSVFLISFEDKDEFVPLNFLGDGFKRIFYIILKTISLKGKRIMIDEIEIGIHYSKMKDFWVNIFKVCKELDVQLFATTHSEECIEAYVEAAKEVNEQNIRLIRLQENKDKSIKAICYPYNSFEDIAESKTENR